MKKILLETINKAKETVKDDEGIMVDEAIVLLKERKGIWELIQDSYMLGYIRGVENTKKMV